MRSPKEIEKKGAIVASHKIPHPMKPGATIEVSDAELHDLQRQGLDVPKPKPDTKEKDA